MNVMVVSADDDVFIPFVSELVRRKNWRVSDYFLGYSSSEKKHDLQESFPGCWVHPNHVASRGMLPEAHRDESLPELDGVILAKMRPYEQMCMRMFDIYDPDGRSFTPLERRSAYYHLLRFGLYFMESRRPDVFIAGSMPNSLHDFMLYCLCRIYGVPTYVYFRSPAEGLVLVYTSLEETPQRLSNAVKRRQLADGPDETLPPHLEEYYRKAKLHYDEGKPWYMKFRKQVLPAKGSDTSALVMSYLRDAKWLLSMGIRFLVSSRRRTEYLVTPQADFFKNPGVPFAKSVSTKMDQALVFKKGYRKKLELLSVYRELEDDKPDLAAPFVFVPLHFQPEASTYPLGWEFIDQEIMIRLLASVVPAGWKILVKEHLVTFDPGRRSEMSRTTDFYRELASIKNVSLVPIELESFLLIDRSKCVASVTGTAGLEAVMRGKPALVFGPAWYAACPGVFDGRTVESCRNAINTIASGYAPGEREVRQFLAAFAEVGLEGRRENVYPLFPHVKPEENIRRLVDHFLLELEWKK